MRKKWLVMGLVVLAGAAGAGGRLTRGDEKTTTPTVSTVAADIGEVRVAVAATGTLQASSSRALSFTEDGTVDSVPVRAGDRVGKGAVLASVDAAAASAAVGDAQDGLDSAEAQLSDAKNSAVAAAEMTATGGGDVILGAQERVNQAEVTLAAAKEALDGATIKAPIAGTVMSVAGPVGSRVREGSTFVTLADTYAMRVCADFPEADAGALAVGQTATVTLADRLGEQFPAKVAQVDAVGTPHGMLVTYGVLLSFTDAPAGLLVGQTASVEVTTGSVAETLRVPSTAVHDAGEGAATVLVRAGGASVVRPVRVGLRGDQHTEISGGLTAGEVVVRSW